MDVLISTLQRKNITFREAKCFAQGHPEKNKTRQSIYLNSYFMVTVKGLGNL